MRFGVLSTATIARVAVIPAIQDSDHEVVAIASRSQDRARTVADEFGIDRAYGSYEALLEDDSLEAVYNPLPNSLHAEWTRRAADRGLDVLCEKPLGVDATEAQRMGEHCERQGVTLMEAFMYRYHPRTERVRTIVDERFDTPRSLTATFQFPLRNRPDDIRLDPELAGGSLMDVGCYPISLARTLFGDPDRVTGRTVDTRDCGVDTLAAGILEYDDGRLARISSGFDTPDRQHYRIEADDGWLEADEAFVPRGDDGVAIEYAVDGRHVTETFEPVDQYRLEVEHFVECVREGRTPRTDAAGAVRTMRVIDALYESAERDRTVSVHGD